MPGRESVLSGLRRHMPELAAGVAGVAWFLAMGGYRAVLPSSLDWVGGDFCHPVIGWLFFRDSSWSLPVGHIDGFPWPRGATVGFTDSNPAVAVAMKLFAPWLPRDFQYVGLWLAACFFLQGWIGARVTALASERGADRTLGGILFALSPALIRRLGHPNLCAHFVLLTLILLHLSRDQDRRSLWIAGALATLSLLFHTYLGTMALVLALALVVRHVATRSVGTVGAAAWVAGMTLTFAATAALFGFTQGVSHRGDWGGFGEFSTDLLAFVNPIGMSWIVPAMPLNSPQWEGMAYLGAGGLALGVTAAVLAVRRYRPDRRSTVAASPLLIAALLLGVYAMSNVIRIGGVEIVGLRRVYQPFTTVTTAFRASGRFIWPLFYVVVAGAVLGTLSLVRARRIGTMILAGAVALQVIDLAPRSFEQQSSVGIIHFTPTSWRFRDAAWSLARGRYDHIALVPPQVVTVDGCYGPYPGPFHWVAPAYEAYKLGMTVNSAFVARDLPGLREACIAAEEEVRAGALHTRTIYVPHESYLPVLLKAGAVCARLDGYDVCVVADAHEPFAAALRERSLSADAFRKPE